VIADGTPESAMTSTSFYGTLAGLGPVFTQKSYFFKKKNKKVLAK